MKVLVFDTETTGLPVNNPSIYQTSAWPHVIQLSYILYDTDKNKIIASQDNIVNIPKCVDISQESIDVHGITRKDTDRRGYEMKGLLETFQTCLENSDFIVAHNIQFDKKILMVEGIRNKIKLNFDKPQEYCTMKNGSHICKIERVNNRGEKYFKYPKLAELHKTIFDTEPNNLHNAFVDILICLRCFHKMIYSEDLCQKNRHFNKQIKHFI